MKKWHGILIAGLFVVFLSACGLKIGTIQDADEPVIPKITVDCDSRSTSVDLNTSQNMTLTISGDGTFPGNCAHFCLAVPEGSKQLEIGISNFATDLDLYVASTSLDKLMDESTDASEFTSNVTGLDPENVSISSPAGGAWYAQVCSYEGVDSDYTLTIGLK